MKMLTCLLSWLRSCGREENAVLHGGEFTHPNLLVQQGEALLLQFTDAAGKGGAGLVETCVGDEKWSPPSVGKLKANWDVSFDTKQKRMGVGVIVRDHNGEVCAEKNEVIQRLHEPDTANG